MIDRVTCEHSTGADIWCSLLYRSCMDWPELPDWLQQVHTWYQQQPVLKPDCWDESVHTSLQYTGSGPRSNRALQSVPMQLADLLMPHITAAAQWFGIADIGTFHLNEIWYNAYGPGQYQDQHRHGNNINMLSGIYYACHDADEHTGTRFYHPGFEWDFDAVTQHAVLYHEPRVSTGDVIIFPSELGHNVPRQRSCQLRVTVSFNVICQPAGPGIYV